VPPYSAKGGRDTMMIIRFNEDKQGIRAII
jgi:hypothetical protein